MCITDTAGWLQSFKAQCCIISAVGAPPPPPLLCCVLITYQTVSHHLDALQNNPSWMNIKKSLLCESKGRPFWGDKCWFRTGIQSVTQTHYVFVSHCSGHLPRSKTQWVQPSLLNEGVSQLVNSCARCCSGYDHLSRGAFNFTNTMSVCPLILKLSSGGGICWLGRRRSIISTFFLFHAVIAQTLTQLHSLLKTEKSYNATTAHQWK